MIRITLFILFLIICLNSYSQRLLVQFTYKDVKKGEVQFENSSIIKKDEIINYKWDFDDGKESNLENPTHVFEYEGDYMVCLTIKTKKGNIDTYCSAISINNSACKKRNNEDLFILYPEISETGKFKLELFKEGNYNIIIYDLLGNIVKQLENIHKTEDKITVDISNCRNGKYFIKIIHEKTFNIIPVSLNM